MICKFHNAGSEGMLLNIKGKIDYWKNEVYLFIIRLCLKASVDFKYICKDQADILDLITDIYVNICI